MSAKYLLPLFFAYVQYEIMAYLYIEHKFFFSTRYFPVDVGISVEAGNFIPKNGYGWIWGIFYRTIRIWMDMDPTKRDGMEWVSEFCPVKGSTLGKLIWVESYRIGYMWTIRVKICIAYPPKGHLRSPEVSNRHLPITFKQKEVKTWDWCQYVRLGQANRLICNMTHFGHHVTLAWIDLGSNFDLDLSRSFYMWFNAP